LALSALKAFQRLGGSAPGRWLFTRLVCLQAPYFGTLGPLVEELAPGRCVATIRDRRRVRNHIGTVHAIALCNLAELTAGLATDVSIPASMRWIPKGMTVRYLRKAKGTMTATCTVPPATSGMAQDLVAHVDVRDPLGEVVFDADITLYVSPRKAG
jgi:acyl-coenzyme A thioesterase PaaI-like protein